MREIHFRHFRTRGGPLRITHAKDKTMPRLPDHLRQAPAHQAGRAEQQHPHPLAPRPPRRWRKIAVRAAVSGSVASVLSIAAATLLARPRTGSAASAANAPSQWLWGESARHRHDVTLRHTLTGYAIHHASSIFWAAAHEAAVDHFRIRPSRAAPLVTAAALVVDYGVVPKRLRPGFEGHLGRGGLVTVYAAFAVGLAVGSRLTRRLR